MNTLQQTPVNIMLRLKFDFYQKVKMASLKKNIDTIDLKRCDIFIFICGLVLYFFIKKCLP